MKFLSPVSLTTRQFVLWLVAFWLAALVLLWITVPITLYLARPDLLDGEFIKSFLPAIILTATFLTLLNGITAFAERKKKRRPER